MNKWIQILLVFLPFFGFSQTDTIVHLHSFGGNNNDNAEEVQATADGGYIVIGSTASSSWGNTDAYLLKVDSLCNYEWSKALGGTNNDWGYSIKQTFDKGFIVAVTTNSFGVGGYDACLMKRDSLGNYVWRKTYGGADWDMVYSVTQTFDSGYVFCGETYNNSIGFSDVYVVRTDPLGDTLWTRTFGGALVDRGNSIIETADSNIVIAGITNSVADSTDIYVIRLEANGSLIWDSIYTDVKYQNVNEIIEHSSGDLMMVGATTSVSVGGDQDYLIKGISASGNSLWIQQYPNAPIPTPDDEEAFAIKEMPNTQILISGYSMTGGGEKKNVIFFKLHASGNWAGASTVVGNSDDDFVKSVTLGNNGNIVAAGSTYSFGAGNEDLLLVRLDTIYGSQDTVTTPYLDVTPLNIIENKPQHKILIYPNPAKDYLSIESTPDQAWDEVRIYSLTGELVVSSGNRKEKIDITSLSRGMYFVELKYESQIIFQSKIIKY